jgi:hypothetical protein
MQFTRFSLAGCAVCLVCLELGAGAPDPKIEDSTVLEKLRDFDSIFESGFTVSGTWQHKDVMRLRRPRMRLTVTRRWKLTFGGDRVGYWTNVIDYEKPKFQQAAAEGPENEMFVNVRTKQWGYWGRDLRGNSYEDTGVVVNSAGEVSERGIIYSSTWYGPRDDGPVPPVRSVVWSLGRFFSPQLDKVTRVEKSADGRLVVSALGKQNEKIKGRWELEIEPAAAWMVRKARFYREKHPDEISAEMKNEGTVWSGSHCIPKEALCNYFGPLDGPETERVTFDPVVEPFDEKLYSEAQEAVLHSQEPTLTVHDNRVSPPRTLYPNKPAPTPPTPPTPASSLRMWILIGNLVLILAVLGFVLFRKRQQTSTEGNAQGNP